MTDRVAVAEPIVYVDSSALVKLVKREPESNALRAYLKGQGSLASSAIARTELLRAVHEGGPAAQARARDTMAIVQIVAVDDDLLADAGRLPPASLRTLDAIHIASALTFGDALSEAVTYDRRMADGFRQASVGVVSPGT